MTSLRLLPLAFVATLAATAPGPARAAEDYDNCTGFIASIPAVISTQGTWCLNKDLATNASSGLAIDVATNNVTIDCNGFKIGNLGAGPASNTAGIQAGSRRNTTVRGCHFRGFFVSVYLPDPLTTGGGHLIENNRIEAAGGIGVLVQGRDNIVRNNQIYEIGFSEGGIEGTTDGIVAHGPVEISNNVISGVRASGAAANAFGIVSSQGATSVLRDNVIRGMQSSSGNAFGIYISHAGVSVHGNEVVGQNAILSTGITCADTYDAVRDNVVGGWATAMTGCTTTLDNLTY